MAAAASKTAVPMIATKRKRAEPDMMMPFTIIRSSGQCTPDQPPSVPNPKFARLRGELFCELRVQRDTRIIMLLVSL